MLTKIRKGISDPVLIPIIIVLVLGIIGMLWYNYHKENQNITKDEEIKNVNALSFKKEYESLNGKMAAYGKEYKELNIEEENPFIKVKPKEIVEKLNKGENFYLYVGDPMCPWCRLVLESAIKSAKANGIDKIYYIDFWDDQHNEILRDVYELVDGVVTLKTEATEEYKIMLDAIDANAGVRKYIVNENKPDAVELEENRFYGATYLFASKGKFIRYTSGKGSVLNPLGELTEEEKYSMVKDFDNFFNPETSCESAC